MPDCVYALMEAMKPPVALTPANRVMIQPAGVKLAKIHNALGLRRNRGNAAISAKAGFSRSYAQIPAFGCVLMATARHSARLATAEM